MTIEIEGKVATVLDEYRIAVNRGSDDGVVKDARVTVWRRVEVRDPDTNEFLDTVRIDTLQLAVDEVRPRTSVARIRSSHSLAIFGFASSPSKQIANDLVEGSTSQVRVNVGDEVSIWVPEPASTAAS